MMKEAAKLYEDSVSLDHEYELYKVRDVHKALKRRIAAMILEAEDVHPTYELVNSLVGIIDSRRPSASYDLPGGITAERRYERLVFLQKEHGGNSHSDSVGCGIKEISIKAISIAEYRELRGNTEKDDLYAAFDLDKLIQERGLKAEMISASDESSWLDINLRTRRSGDYIGTGNGSKKLQVFLVDEKVPKASRDEIKLAAMGSEILWILPNEMFKSERYRIKGKYSQKYQVDNSSERVLFLELR